MAEYYTIITKAGSAAMVDSQLNNKPVNITHLAVGDGGGTPYSPDDTATALKEEKWRGLIIEKTPDPDNPHIIQFKTIIPPEVGGFFVREIGVFAEDGTLMYVGNFPEAYKVSMDSGASSEFPINMRCLFTSTENVVMEVDPYTATASQAWVERNYVKLDPDTQKILDSMLPNHLRSAEEGMAALTNTMQYPHSNAVYTVALDIERDNTDYNVTTEVVSSAGGCIEDVYISDKQVNGFKLHYLGGAASANIRYLVTGGLE